MVTPVVLSSGLVAIFYDNHKKAYDESVPDSDESFEAIVNFDRTTDWDMVHYDCRLIRPSRYRVSSQ